MQLEDRVATHYTGSGRTRAILEALRAAGLDPDRLSVDDLAPVGEFHIRGREATAELGKGLCLGAGQHALDVGSGIGGASRHFAQTHGARITGIDLTPEYCELATRFARSTGLADLLDYRPASALALPFEPATFDAAYSQHVAMNIADKPALYAEIARVLKPGSRAVVTTNGRNDLRAYYALGAAAFGGSATNPAAAVFGFEEAEALMGAEFGNVAMARHPARLRITEPGHVFDSLTSYPPGEDASEAEQSALRTAIADTFAQGGGVLEVAKETAVFVSRKAC
jgi:SAM-dependent methyltransferase